jgi:hypothetical protein
VTPEHRQFLQEFYTKLREMPLDQTDRRYEPLWDVPALIESDPVDLMLRSILWTPVESVQLFAGFRGAGKTTELRRLATALRDKGYLVILCDVEDYLNMSTAVDVSDFLMAMAGAFGEALKDEALLGADAKHEGYWERLWSFLNRTRVSLDELGGEIGGLGVKANLKSDPTFRQKLQERMAGHLGALVADVRQFFAECILALKEAHGEEKEVVLLVDSVEHIRGTSVNAEQVQAAVERLFTSHAEQLHIPSLHVVYTVHPYLKVRYANLGALYEPGGVKVLPSVKVLEKSGATSPPGLAAMRRVVDKRGDWRQLLGSEEALERLILASGGHLRDLVRLLREVVLRAKVIPVPAETVDAAMNQIRNESLPIADADALWLDRIAKTHSASLETSAGLADFARFLDTHVVLCYWNGHEWYDVHPLLRSAIAEQAAHCAAAPDH